MCYALQVSKCSETVYSTHACIQCYFGRQQKAAKAYHLLCHADKGKSLLDKHMEDMPLLSVGHPAASIHQYVDPILYTRLSRLSHPVLAVLFQCQAALT